MNTSITIGIPVYNEESRIEAAIRSSVTQCDRLIVSDNASTDNTESICRRLANEFTNIDYVRQPENIGALRNWYSILDRVDSEYLMLMGAHDRIAPNYVSTLLPLLQSDHTVLGAFGTLEYEYEADGARRIDEDLANWSGGMLATPEERVRALLYSHVPVVWAVYGLYRTATIREIYREFLHPYGVDVLFLAHLLARGKLQVSADTYYHGWIRDNRGNRYKYLDRLLHTGHGRKLSDLKNELRIAQHDFIRLTLKPAGFIDEFRYRMLSTIHFGTFKYPGLDPLFYLTYPAAKLARRVIRIQRKLARRHA